MNLYPNGNACMGNVDVRISKAASLEEFTAAWQGVFLRELFQPPDRGAQSHQGQPYHPIHMSCVDSAAARFGITQVLQYLPTENHYADVPRYWMDFGNGKDTGQVLLSTIGSIEQPASKLYDTVESLPFVTKEFAEQLMQAADEDMPSCSLAKALEKQDLFINSALAQMGCSLLWKIFREGIITQRGFFLNLRAYRAEPLPLA